MYESKAEAKIAGGCCRLRLQSIVSWAWLLVCVVEGATELHFVEGVTAMLSTHITTAAALWGVGWVATCGIAASV